MKKLAWFAQWVQPSNITRPTVNFIQIQTMFYIICLFNFYPLSLFSGYCIWIIKFTSRPHSLLWCRRVIRTPALQYNWIKVKDLYARTEVKRNQPYVATALLQPDLKSVSDWASTWQLPLNISKCILVMGTQTHVFSCFSGCCASSLWERSQSSCKPKT